jgi:hypothetical protein
MGIQDAAPDVSSASGHGVVNAVVTIETFMAVMLTCQRSVRDQVRRRQ